MSEVKSRKKSGTKGAPAEPGKRSEGGKSPEAPGGGGRGWADPRTGVSLLSLGTCLGLACGSHPFIPPFVGCKPKAGSNRPGACNDTKSLYFSSQKSLQRWKTNTSY